MRLAVSKTVLEQCDKAVYKHHGIRQIHQPLVSVQHFLGFFIYRGEAGPVCSQLIAFPFVVKELHQFMIPFLHSWIVLCAADFFLRQLCRLEPQNFLLVCIPGKSTSEMPPHCLDMPRALRLCPRDNPVCPAVQSTLVPYLFRRSKRRYVEAMTVHARVEMGSGSLMRFSME